MCAYTHTTSRINHWKQVHLTAKYICSIMETMFVTQTANTHCNMQILSRAQTPHPEKEHPLLYPLVHTVSLRLTLNYTFLLTPAYRCW